MCTYYRHDFSRDMYVDHVRIRTFSGKSVHPIAITSLPDWKNLHQSGMEKNVHHLLTPVGIMGSQLFE